MDLGLTGKVAVVAAASRGLGKAVAAALCAEGARIVLFSRREDASQEAAREMERTGPGQAIGLSADVTRPGDLERVVEVAVERFGRLDILVNSAGGPPPGTFDTLVDEDWEKAIQLTLMSAVRLTRLALPHLKRSPTPRIVNLTSTSTREPIANLLLSNAIRAAVAGWSKTLATELAPSGVLVNCLAPGRIATERIRELDEANARRQGKAIEEVVAASEAAIPLRRLGRPDEFAAAAAFLASERASYITGTTLVVDGGKMACVV